MAKTSTIALTAASVALLLAGQAYAITLTNRDSVDQQIQISEGGDETVTRDVVLEAGQSLDGFCEGGCTIALESGAQESFEGDETVFIEDGEFRLAE
jgi:hypothetical protein